MSVCILEKQIMQRLKASAALGITACAFVVLGAPAVRADGWAFQGPVVYRSYYAPAQATYFHSCQPVYASQPTPSAHTTYYVPQMQGAPQSSQLYGQPTQGYSQARPQTFAPARPTTTATVGAFDNYFEPKTIHVQPGSTVRWINRGRHAHTVTAEDDRWDSGDIPPGGSYTATFQRPGTYRYYCRHHTDDKMQGTIVVGPGGRSGHGGVAQDGAATDSRRGEGYGSVMRREGASQPRTSTGRASGY
jgi:plastocyanin